ncbi:MAG: hypothetical protein A2X49_07285 [Lentisphaerae bacterium GWF2_52_8]|nr:MAG: hypothetical protein A2X49_07285 [Lentisphaerae bacterium GWF2_52_8]
MKGLFCYRLENTQTVTSEPALSRLLRHAYKSGFPLHGSEIQAWKSCAPADFSVGALWHSEGAGFPSTPGLCRRKRRFGGE